MFSLLVQGETVCEDNTQGEISCTEDIAPSQQHISVSTDHTKQHSMNSIVVHRHMIILTFVYIYIYLSQKVICDLWFLFFDKYGATAKHPLVSGTDTASEISVSPTVPKENMNDQVCWITKSIKISFKTRISSY